MSKTTISQIRIPKFPWFVTLPRFPGWLVRWSLAEFGREGWGMLFFKGPHRTPASGRGMRCDFLVDIKQSNGGKQGQPHQNNGLAPSDFHRHTQDSVSVWC
jgi:hypothetical protein